MYKKRACLKKMKIISVLSNINSIVWNRIIDQR